MNTSKIFGLSFWLTLAVWNGYDAWTARGTGWALVSVFAAALCVAWALECIR